MKPVSRRSFLKCAAVLPAVLSARALHPPRAALIPVDHVYARNAVNATIFRNAIQTHGDLQYCSYWSPEGRLTVARRLRSETRWDIRGLDYVSPNLHDAHNSISLGISPDGYLHLSFDHHNHPIRYRMSDAPGSLSFREAMPMTGLRESRVTYPQFINSPEGRFYFVYREGGSGNGDVLINLYEPETRSWRPLQHPLITGEGKANAYWWLPGVGPDESVHLAWCWRRSPDAATNQNVCYAVSRDGGHSWEGSDGSAYRLPITFETSEVVDRVPEGSNLINQCSSYVDALGRPHLAHYKNDENGHVQIYHVHFDGARWLQHQVTQRSDPKYNFSLGGRGTLRLPISRPHVVVDRTGVAYVVYRDAEAGSRVRASYARAPFERWQHADLTEFDVLMWEPSYDPVAMREYDSLELWVHPCEQGMHEGSVDLPAQQAYVLTANLPALRETL